MGWLDEAVSYVPGTTQNQNNNPYAGTVFNPFAEFVGSIPSGKELGGEVGQWVGQEQVGRNIGQYADFGGVTGFGGARTVTETLANKFGGKGTTPVPPPNYNVSDPNQLATLEQQRQKTLAELQATEAQMKGSLLSQTGETGKAIDKQLSQLIGQTGYFTGLANQTTAASMAAKGMGRSGMTAGALQSNALRGQQAIGTARQTAETQKRSVSQNAIDAQQQVADKRKEIANRLTDLEISGLKDQRMQEEMTTMKAQFTDFVNNLKMSTQAKQDLYGMLGGLGTLGGLFAGYGMTGSSTTGTTKAQTTQFSG